MPIVRTTCSRDCPDTCSIDVVVEGGRAVRLSGNPDDPVTRGFLCERTNKFLARQYSADRITEPLVRRDGRLEPLSWDNALNLAAERLLRIREESGGASILYYRSGGSLGLLKGLGDLLFGAFGPVTVKHGDVCSGAGEAAQLDDFGVSDSHDLFDLLNSRLIVLWGKNPHTSGPHLLPVLKAAKQRGARIVLIDPVRTKAALIADDFVQIKPGGDFDLALGVAHVLFRRGAVSDRARAWAENATAYEQLAMSRTVDEWAAGAGVRAADALRVADHFMEQHPANIQVGWGMARRTGGAAIVRAVDALGVITGNLGVSGGGVSYYFGRRGGFDQSYMDGVASPPRTLSEPRLGEEILSAKNPEIRAAWVTAGNPVTMLPDSMTVRRALSSREFTVVVDTHPTDTTDVAHLVLPTLTLLEDDDVLGAYGNHFIRESRPAVAPPPNCRHELEIWQDLARRLGLGSLLAGSPKDWKRRMMTTFAKAGVTLDDLQNGPRRKPGAPQVLFADGRTQRPNGRVNLIATAPPPMPLPSAEWPLLLQAASHPRFQSSQAAVPGDPAASEVRVHPDSAIGFADGAPARLRSQWGAMDVIVRHDLHVHPQVALIAKGGMLRDGRCSNALLAAVETDQGCGAAYYDEPVRLEVP